MANIVFTTCHAWPDLLVFIGRAFSHAIQKVPQPGEFRVNSQYQGDLKRAEPADAIVEQARAVLLALPEMPLYPRVDGVVAADQRFCLLEL